MASASPRAPFSSVKIAKIEAPQTITLRRFNAILTLENGARGDALAIVTGKDVEARLATAGQRQERFGSAGRKRNQDSERTRRLGLRALPNDQRGWIPASSAERVADVERGKL